MASHIEIATDEQLSVINSEGEVFVSAAPGSGKTWTAARLFVNRVRSVSHKRRGVALLSYTNVAVEEFKRKILDLDSSIDVESINYVGTMDSFVEKFVISQFYYVVPGLIHRPFCASFEGTVGLSIPSNVSKLDFPISINDIYSEVDGDKILYKCKRFKNDQTGAQLPVESVFSLFMRGLISFRRYTHEMRWFLVDEIMKSNSVKRCLSNRFEEIIIDEAQDTRGVAFRFFSMLRDADSLPCNVSLIGDVNQSIYSFAGAAPEIYLQVAQVWKLKKYRINTNRRCSEKVVEGINRFFGENMRALPGSGGNGVYYMEYTRFEKIGMAEISSHFKVDKGKVKVLSRRNQRPRVTPYLDMLFSSCIERDFNNNLKASCDKLMHFIRIQANICAVEYEKDVLLKELWPVCKDKEAFPSLNSTWNTWRAAVKVTLQRLACILNIDDIGISRLRKPNDLPEETNISDFLQCYSDVQTVHSVKGESHEGVVFVDNKFSWAKLFNHKSEDGHIIDEELRIMYVAMTRARNFVLLVIPDTFLLRNRAKVEKKVERLIM